MLEIYKIPLYEPEEYKRVNINTNWPGKRSFSLFSENKFLYFLILQNLHKVSFLKKYTLDLFLHLRREQDYSKDWIHTDNDDYAFLIYLNKTNLNSGTYLYDENKNIISDIKYNQQKFFYTVYPLLNLRLLLPCYVIILYQKKKRSFTS